MGSRKQILRQIRGNRPSSVQLPAVPDFVGLVRSELSERFKKALERAGGKAFRLSPQTDLKSRISELCPDCRAIASTDARLSTIEIDHRSSRADLRRIELAILRGRLGVAENGAVWLPEEEMLHRAVPFIAEHLILLLRESEIVENMHQAYKSISLALPNRSLSRYGVFIAGPSKTADIEQSLVIGAHGPRSLIVLLE